MACSKTLHTYTACKALPVSVSQVPCLHSKTCKLHSTYLPVRSVLGALQDEQLSAAAATLLKQLVKGGVGRRVVEAGATAAACQVLASPAAVQTQLTWLQLLAELAASAATCELVCKQLAQKPAAPAGKGRPPVRVQAATWELALLMQIALESAENSRGVLLRLAQFLLVLCTWCCLQGTHCTSYQPCTPPPETLCPLQLWVMTWRLVACRPAGGCAGAAGRAGPTCHHPGRHADGCMR